MRSEDRFSRAAVGYAEPPHRLCRGAVRGSGHEESDALRFSFWRDSGLPVPEGGVCVDLEVSRVFLQGPCPMRGTWCPNLLLRGDWAGRRVAAGTGVASETVPCGHPYVSTGRGPCVAAHPVTACTAKCPFTLSCHKLSPPPKRVCQLPRAEVGAFWAAD